MQIKPIRTEEDYDDAMARLEEIFGAPPDSPESDELEILLALAGAYEKKHHRIEPPDPVTLLEYRMDQMGLSKEEVLRFMACRKRIPEILSRETGISLEIIKSLTNIPLEAFTTDCLQG
jgi:HTH-type transcriptional regulator/antitoxin HigA